MTADERVSAPIVETQHGRIRGLSERGVLSFRGVPYGGPTEGAGQLRAFHTAELPLALRLVRYPKSERLSRQIAGAWAAFARTGDPTHAELPDWPAYDPARRATMLFDLPASRPVDDPDAEARRFLLDWPHPAFL